MDPLEANTHAFIVKVWLEQAEDDTGRATFRGHVTHAMTGQRHAIKRLRDIPRVIASYLEQGPGASGSWFPPRWWRRRRW